MPPWSRSILTALVMTLALTARATAGPDPLTAEDAENLINGNTLIGFTPKDQSTFKSFYSTSGQVRALVVAGDERTRVVGRWWVNGEGKLCNEWDTFGYVDACHAIGFDSETVTFIDDSGRIISFAEILEGNAEGL